MPIQIEKPGGGLYSKEELGTLGTADGKVEAGAEAIAEKVLAAQEVPSRTRLDVAKEADFAESKLAAARFEVAFLEAEVKKLNEELRYFGVKRRGPRKGKE